MSGHENVKFRDNVEQFFQTKAIVYQKQSTRAPGHALSSAISQCLRIDLIKIGTANGREVISVRPWLAEQGHGWFSTVLNCAWIPYMQQQVMQSDVGNASIILTADLNGCTVTATRGQGSFSFAHIAADCTDRERNALVQQADFVWGPDQYDPLMREGSGFETHFVCGMKRNGRWDFYAQGKTSGMDSYKPNVIYSRRVAAGV